MSDFLTIVAVIGTPFAVFMLVAVIGYRLSRG